MLVRSDRWYTCCPSDGNNTFAPLGFCLILSAEHAIRMLSWVFVTLEIPPVRLLMDDTSYNRTITHNSVIGSTPTEQSKTTLFRHAFVHGATSIFIFCFWNQQRNDAIQSLLTEERKWHIWGPAVIPRVLWESDYFSWAGALKWDPLLFLTYALR